ncbi:MAG: hypothetical protein NXI04_19160 [Planctomycetaceae bacterium]|nr:hypothetical protein [Planctomycetaceae bacterium]
MSWRVVFIGIQSWGWTVAVAAAIALALFLFLTLRKYETRLVTPGISRTLLALRLLLLTMLVLVLLQPVLTEQWDTDRQSRLVVAVDVSHSMDTSDRHASPAEMLRWGQALGMLGNAGTQAMLDEWSQAWDAGRTPDFGQGDRQLGRIRREQLDGVFAEIARMPRTEFVRRLLLASPNDLLKKLGDIQPVDLRAFGGDEMTVTESQIPELLKSSRLEIRPGATDAAAVLASVVTESDTDVVQGVVLLTDGRQTESADFAAEAARLKQLGIPVYTVPIGSRLLPRDLSIASLEYPETVFLEDTAEVRATITSTGYAGEEVTVVLTKEGVPVDERTVTVAADYFDVNFAIAADEAGSAVYRVETAVRPGELREDNNEREFTVSVVDNKSRVILVEGDPRWEFRYLKSALERDKRVDLSVILLNPPYLKLLNRPFIDNQFPDTDTIEQQLRTADILILGDIPADTIPDASWRAIEGAVSNGLTLLFVPGKQHLPHTYQSPLMKDLLPVTDPRQQVADKLERTRPGGPQSTFRMAPTPAASDLTLFRLTSPGADRPMTIDRLPGHPWAYTGTPKPGATVWATLKLPSRQLSNELAGVVHQYYGFGQTVWLGIDSTWRWRRRAGDRWHHRFWGQLVRWAAQNKAASGNDQVRFSLSEVVAEESESVTASVRWDPKLVNRLQNAKVSVVITAQAGPEGAMDQLPPPQTVPLQPTESAPERYSADLPPLPAGTYDVSVELENADIQLEQQISSELIIQQKTSSELANVSCNRDLLQQIADASDGVLLDPWELSSLPDLVRPENMSSTELRTETLWDKWPVMLLFFIVLTLEWVVRKLNGLP